MDGSVDPGSYVALAAFQSVASSLLGRSDVVLDSGATANLACSEWIRIRNGLLKNAGYQEAAPRPALARFRFGDEHVESAQNTAEFPIALAGQMGVLFTFLAEQTIPASMGEGDAQCTALRVEAVAS